MTKAQILREVLELPTADRLDLAASLQELVHPQDPEENRSSNRWHVLAERLEQQGFLDGRSDEAKALLRQGRFTL
jgi:hypothetical protein